MPEDTLLSPADADARSETPSRASQIEDFALIVGGMKCGSTSLYDYLVTHPQVAACRIKEPNFFSASKAEERPGRYAALWPDFDPARHKVALEASVAYTKLPRFPRVVSAIEAHRRRFGSRFRFIYIMRDPVDRAESHIAHNISKGRCSHEDYVSSMRLALDTSRYATQIARYRRFAGADGLLLLNFDELKSDPLGLLARCVRFLGLEDFAFEIRPPSNVRSSAHDSTSFRLSEVERAWLRAALAGEMETLARRHDFDVTGWGFPRGAGGKSGAKSGGKSASNSGRGKD